MPKPSPIAQRIIRERDQRHMTKAELARRAGIDQSYMSRLESGSIVEPSPARLQQIADALSVPVRVLLETSAPTVDVGLAQAVAEALGCTKAHLFEAAIEALRELPPDERDQAIDVLHVIAVNWPRRP